MQLPEIQTGIPVIGLDVWEHAYYLNYQNKRYDYIDSFWKVINWDVADKHYSNIKKKSIRLKMLCRCLIGLTSFSIRKWSLS